MISGLRVASRPRDMQGRSRHPSDEHLVDDDFMSRKRLVMITGRCGLALTCGHIPGHPRQCFCGGTSRSGSTLLFGFDPGRRARSIPSVEEGIDWGRIGERP